MQNSTPKVKTVTSQDKYLLITELESRENAHQVTLSCVREEVEELRKTRRYDAELREEASQDAVSHEGEKILDTELLESQSTVNQLAHQIRELHEVTNSLSDSQDFKDLETASSPRSTHAPGKP